jgi:hypothetical protein
MAHSQHSSLTRRALASRLGQTLFVLHLVLAVYAIAHKPPATEEDFLYDCQAIAVAGKAIRVPEEGPLLKTIALLDLPSLFARYFVFILPALLLGDHIASLSSETLTLIQTVTLFILTGVQWWATGFFIQALWEHVTRARRQRLNGYRNGVGG